MRRPVRQTPAQVSRAYNVTQAMMKIGTAPLATLTPAMVESIARTHKVPLVELQARLSERMQREARP